MLKLVRFHFGLNSKAATAHYNTYIRLTKVLAG